MNNKNHGFNLFSVIVIIFLSSVISAITTGVIVNNTYKTSSGVSYNELAKDEDLSEFLDVYSTITSNYYENIDKKKLLESAVEAMTNYLDDSYTTYMDNNERESLAEKLEGTYKGIGVTINERTIEDVTKDSPAEEVGLQKGDVITKVDDIDVTEYDAAKIAILIKSSDKETIKLTILRAEQELEFNVDLKELILPALSYKMIDNSKTGYIYISIFSTNIKDQFKNALNELKKQGMERLILDVRENSGGYLEGADKIANMFLKKGKLIYSLKDKKRTEKIYDKTKSYLDIPVVVIINNNSASASEILAAALKDSYGATIVGTNSFGKGKVQQIYNLEDGSMVKYTAAKWLRPNGDCVDKKGITPDIYVELPKVEQTEQTEQVEQTTIVDTQLQKAIEHINTLQ